MSKSYKIYDAHMHIGGSAEPAPEKLLEDLHKAGIYGGSVISIDPEDPGFTYAERVRNLQQWTQGYENRLFPVAWIHPDEKDVFDKVRELSDMGVVAFKFIPTNYYVYDQRPLEVFSLIEELGKPIIFHSGILYDFSESINVNKPANWECFLRFKNIRFSMGHCAHPWSDECLMLYGKFDWIKYHTECAAKGLPTIYKNYDWVQQHLIHGPESEGTADEDSDVIGYQVPKLYLDTTPGAHGQFRRDLLTNIYSMSPDCQQVFFGSDHYVEDYHPKIVAHWLKEEKELFNSLGASKTFFRRMYQDNYLEFIGK